MIPRAPSRHVTLRCAVRAATMLLVCLMQSALAQDGFVDLDVIAEVPLRMRGSRVTVDVTINGQGPFAFGLDTGASGAAWISAALVEELKLPAAEGFVVSDGSGMKGRRAEGARIDTLTIGSALFHRLTATVLQEESPQRWEEKVYGTLGFELFSHHVVTFDYPAQKLRIANGQLPVPDGKHVLSYRLDRGASHISVNIGEVNVEAMIDSGNMGGVLLPLSLATEVPLREQLQHAGRVASAFSEFDLFRAELDGDLRLGEIAISGPTLYFSDLVQTPSLGRGVIHSFAVTFDQPNTRVRFVRPGTEE